MRERNRNTILARRALFIASAMQGLLPRSAHADEPATTEPNTPVEPPPEPCLSPMRPPDRVRHDAIEVTATMSPSAWFPVAAAQSGDGGRGAAVSFAPTTMVGVRLSMARRWDLDARWMVAPIAFGGATMLAMGGYLGVSTTAITSREWDEDYRTFVALDVGTGALLAARERGLTPTDHQPARGVFVDLQLTPIGFRHRFGRHSFGSGYHSTFKHTIELGVRFGALFTQQHSADDARFGLSHLTMGFAVTYAFQLKPPSTERFDEYARR